MADASAKKRRASSGPKPVYIVYTAGDEGVPNFISVTRNAAKALAAMDETDGAKYAKALLD